MPITKRLSPAEFSALLSSQRERWFLWYPVAVIAGIAGYFALPREPHMLVFVLAGLVAAGCLWVLMRHRFSLKLVLTLLLLTGFVVAKLRTESVRPDVLRATTPTTMLHGVVVKAENRGGRASRLL
ncbi:MAG TPA: hypothetical protein ENJ55_01750, partial [Rhizobiales bacterium]|nr:hypothetical protein [Hyphomicrobiales bacterium]